MPHWFQTTAIDYPNSRPHIGTAFEKIGADVQARYRRMEGYDVHLPDGQRREHRQGRADAPPSWARTRKAYCDDMARQFKEVWRALDISFDDFMQTSEPRHHAAASKFIQKVYDNGYIYKGELRGLVLRGLRGVQDGDRKSRRRAASAPIHKTPPVRRSEPCYYFALSKFQDRLLKLLRGESRLHPAGEPAQRDRRRS